MSRLPVSFVPIGTIHSPFATCEGMPIQPAGARGVRGQVEVDEQFAAGLKDLDGFSHVILLYHFHQAKACSLLVTPFLDAEPRGVFSTRAPRRPNPIGLSVVEIERIDGCTIHVKGIDVLDGTPLLDLKPYVPAFDHAPGARTGWLESRAGAAGETRADARFTGS